MIPINKMNNGKHKKFKMNETVNKNNKIKLQVINISKITLLYLMIINFFEKSYCANTITLKGEGKCIIDKSIGITAGDNNEILEELIGKEINSKADLLSLLQEYNIAKKEYDGLKYALNMVKQTGYGIATPSIEDMTLEKPEIIKQGSRYGVKLKAIAPSIHMIRVDVESTFEPIIGSELQSKELIDYLLKDQNKNKNEIWKSEIFGRSLDSIVQEGIQSKINLMPDNIRFKLQNTLTRVINKGSNNIITIVIVISNLKIKLIKKD